MRADSFKDYVLDQLRLLPAVRARAMFGAPGLYQGERFFAILDAGRLFFKTDAANEADYAARNMAPFTYEQRGKQRTMGCREVPLEILEQPQELAAWARKSIQAAAKTARSPDDPPTKKAVRRRPR